MRKTRMTDWDIMEEKSKVNKKLRTECSESRSVFESHRSFLPKLRVGLSRTGDPPSSALPPSLCSRLRSASARQVGAASRREQSSPRLPPSSDFGETGRLAMQARQSFCNLGGGAPPPYQSLSGRTELPLCRGAATRSGLYRRAFPRSTDFPIHGAGQTTNSNSWRCGIRPRS